jgi:hypothetical protein
MMPMNQNGLGSPPLLPKATKACGMSRVPLEDDMKMDLLSA